MLDRLSFSYFAILCWMVKKLDKKTTLMDGLFFISKRNQISISGKEFISVSKISYSGSSACCPLSFKISPNPINSFSL